MNDFNPFSLIEKTIIITGASSGIGAQTAIDCSKMGARVLLLGRDKDRLNATLSKTAGNGNQSFSLDLTNYYAIEELVKKIELQKLRIDGLINAAGITTTLPFKNALPDKFESFMQTNVFGGVELTRLLIKVKLFNPKGASVIFLSSVMGVVGENAKSLYSASKGALISLTKSLAIEYAKKGIRFNCISPAVIETPMTKDAAYFRDEISKSNILQKHPLGLGSTEDIANACIYLVSDASRWVTGTNLLIDGGYTAQ